MVALSTSLVCSSVYVMLFRKALQALKICWMVGGCGCDFGRADSLSWHSEGDGGKPGVGAVLDSVTN